MRPNKGDQVKLSNTRQMGTVEEVDGDDVVVSIDGSTRRWSRRNVTRIARTIAPRGLARVDDRKRAAARMQSEGMTRAEIARIYGISVHTLCRWLEDVAQAAADARIERGWHGVEK